MGRMVSAEITLPITQLIVRLNTKIGEETTYFSEKNVRKLIFACFSSVFRDFTHKNSEEGMNFRGTI